MDKLRSTLASGEIYHVFTKSIAGFEILNHEAEFLRMEDAMQYYQTEKQGISFSKFQENKIEQALDSKKLVEIISYCLMPTHIHLALKQLRDKGISDFMRHILDSYTRYFNIKHNRKGPLWEGRFKRVLVKNDEQLLHLTRYIHLNPVTAYIVNNPADWKYSSYKEYIGVSIESGMCKFNDILDINTASYKIFVENRIGYQRELAKIKNLMLD